MWVQLIGLNERAKSDPPNNIHILLLALAMHYWLDDSTTQHWLSSSWLCLMSSKSLLLSMIFSFLLFTITQQYTHDAEHFHDIIYFLQTHTLSKSDVVSSKWLSRPGSSSSENVAKNLKIFLYFSLVHVHSRQLDGAFFLFSRGKTNYILLCFSFFLSRALALAAGVSMIKKNCEQLERNKLGIKFNFIFTFSFYCDPVLEATPNFSLILFFFCTRNFPIAETLLLWQSFFHLYDESCC